MRRMISMRRIFSSCVPWEKFRRKTSTPETSSRRIISSVVQAGPRVAMIFVRRMDVFESRSPRTIHRRRIGCFPWRREGYVVDCASDGREALASIEANDYHAILLDLGMPYVHGSTLLSIVQQTKP